MKIAAIKTIVREELAKFGDLPKFVDPMLQTLNQFINQVGTALKGNLTFEDNFFCRQKVVTLTSGVAQEINPDPSKRFKVIGVICLDSGGLGVDKFNWVQVSNGNVQVTINFNSGTSAQCRIVIFLG